MHAFARLVGWPAAGHAVTAVPPSRPPGKPRRRSSTRAAGTTTRKYAYFFAGALFALFALALIYVRYIYPRAVQSRGQGALVAFELTGGESASELAATLDTLGLVDSPMRFAWFARVYGLKPAAGTHALVAGLSVGDLAARLERSGAKAKVTIPEGFTSFDIAKRLESEQICARAAFVRVTHEADFVRRMQVIGDSLEGYLFPATYEFPRNSDPHVVAERMKVEFDKRLAQLESEHPRGRLELDQSLGWGTREIVTLASMIEKEAVQHDERPVIASVFLNRLRLAEFGHKVLQCDPTAGYGCVRAKERGDTLPSGCATFTGKITPAVNNDVSNMYSTYTHVGLPPGPISSPGAKSLAAVFSPSSTRYLYFVARGEGRHTFSENYETHQKAVRPPHDAP
jgi:UPF0755 protein